MSRADLNRYIDTVSGDNSDTWQSRPVEDLMTTRLSLPAVADQLADSSVLAAGTDITCIPIVEQNHIVGIMTRDDVLISWSRLEPALRAAGLDDVTQLSNRAMFIRRLNEEWARSSQSS